MPYAPVPAPAGGPPGDFMYGGGGGGGFAAPPPGGATRATISGPPGIFTLMPGMEMRAGRDGAACQILLSEPRVSGTHATVRMDGGQVLVRDAAEEPHELAPPADHHLMEVDVVREGAERVPRRRVGRAHAEAGRELDLREPDAGRTDPGDDVVGLLELHRGVADVEAEPEVPAKRLLRGGGAQARGACEASPRLLGEDRALEEDLKKGIVRKRRPTQNAGEGEQP